MNSKYVSMAMELLIRSKGGHEGVRELEIICERGAAMLMTAYAEVLDLKAKNRQVSSELDDMKFRMNSLEK